MPDGVTAIETRVDKDLSHAAIRAAVGGLGKGKITEGLGFDAARGSVIEATLNLIQAGQGRKALEELGKGETKDKGLKGGWEEVLKAQIYTNVDEYGQRIPRTETDEVVRFNEAKLTMQVYDEYLKRGIDNLTGTLDEVVAKKRVLRDQIKGFLKGNEVLRKAVESPKKLIPNEVIDNLLRDQMIKIKLGSFLNTLYDPSTLADEKDFLQKAAKLAQANKIIEHLSNDINSGLEKKAKAETERIDFQTSATYGATGVTKQVTMDNLERQLYASTEAIVRNLKSNLEEKVSIEKEIKRRESAGAEVPVGLLEKLTKANDKINNALGETATRAVTLEFKKLFEEKSRIDSIIADAVERIRTTEEAIAAKHAEDTGTAVQRAALSKEFTKRQRQSGEYSSFVKKALFEVAQQTIAERAKNFIETYHTEEPKAIFVATREYKAQIDSHIQNRWIYHARRNFWHRLFKSIKIDRKRTKEDINILLGDGPTAFARKVLRDAKVPEDKVELLLKGDDYKVENSIIEEGKRNINLGPKMKEILHKVLVAYVAGGGNLKDKEDQLETIAFADWGQQAIESLRLGEEIYGQNRRS